MPNLIKTTLQRTEVFSVWIADGTRSGLVQLGANFFPLLEDDRLKFDGNIGGDVGEQRLKGSFAGILGGNGLVRFHLFRRNGVDGGPRRSLLPIGWSRRFVFVAFGDLLEARVLIVRRFGSSFFCFFTMNFGRLDLFFFFLLLLFFFRFGLNLFVLLLKLKINIFGH